MLLNSRYLLTFQCIFLQYFLEKKQEERRWEEEKKKLLEPELSVECFELDLFSSISEKRGQENREWISTTVDGHS